MTNKPVYAIRLAQLRNVKGITQEQLASLAQLTRGRLNNYEQGIREPDIETLKALAKLLNCSTDYLIGSSDSLFACTHEDSAPLESVRKYGSAEKEDDEFWRKIKNLSHEKRKAIEILITPDEKFTKDE